MNQELNSIGATNLVALFETTKAERGEFVTMLLDAMNSGSVDATLIHTQVKAMEDLCKQILENKEYKELVLAEAEKNGKEFTRHGQKFSIREVGVKYDFESCGDPLYNVYNAQLDELMAKINERKAFLKGIPTEGIDTLEPLTGELIKITPPVKTSTTSVVVNLK